MCRQYLSICLPVCLSACLSICLSLDLAIRLCPPPRPYLVIPDLDGLGLDLFVGLVDDIEAFDVSENGSLGLPIDLDGSGAQDFGLSHFDDAILQLRSNQVQIELRRRRTSVFCEGKRLEIESLDSIRTARNVKQKRTT